MEMQLLAGELLAKSERRETLSLFPPRSHASPSLKSTHGPHITFQNHLSHPVMPLFEGIRCARDQRKRANPLWPTLRACSGHKQPSQHLCPSGIHTKPSLVQICPNSSKHSFYSPSSWPLLLPRPPPGLSHPPPSPLLSPLLLLFDSNPAFSRQPCSILQLTLLSACTWQMGSVVL